tara:strand:- start:1324 stop:1875 length:552 start_codon:yes stop_codon:yes gene_type:complete
MNSIIKSQLAQVLETAEVPDSPNETKIVKTKKTKTTKKVATKRVPVKAKTARKTVIKKKVVVLKKPMHPEPMPLPKDGGEKPKPKPDAPTPKKEKKEEPTGCTAEKVPNLGEPHSNNWMLTRLKNSAVLAFTLKNAYQYRRELRGKLDKADTLEKVEAVFSGEGVESDMWKLFLSHFFNLQKF